MRILFVNAHIFYSEPLGTLQLSAVCKAKGHETRLAVLTRHSMAEMLESFQPDLVGYSVMTPNEHMFIKADQEVQRYIERTGRAVTRIMGGPHPTYFHAVLNKMELDAIVVGDGDFAITTILDRLSAGSNLENIPNVIPAGSKDFQFKKEIVPDLDELPYLDRDIFYEAAPEFQSVGLRGFQTQRGCPYKCTYCFNHSFNRMFKGESRKLFRRRSVDDLIADIKQVQRDYAPVRFLRFSDDVFAIRRDEWLEEFAERYPKEVGLPFYCLIRADAMKPDVAELLAKAGCRSVSLSIEAGSTKVRNIVLKRNMPDQVLIDAFNVTRQYGINTHSNTMMGLPGTSLDDDLESFMFARKLRPTAPTFGIFCPFPKMELTEYAQEQGLLPDEFDYNTTYKDKSVLTNYSEEEKQMQLRLSYLAYIFCYLPKSFVPIMKFMMKLNLTPVYRIAANVVESYFRSFKIFPGVHPINPLEFAKNAYATLVYLVKMGNRNQNKEEKGWFLPMLISRRIRKNVKSDIGHQEIY